jgi:hypothetical protein
MTCVHVINCTFDLFMGTEGSSGAGIGGEDGIGVGNERGGEGASFFRIRPRHETFDKSNPEEVLGRKEKGVYWHC